MHHYTLCGLDNVWLENGYALADTEDGPVVSIVDLDGLHRAIAIDIATKHGGLNGKELRFLRSMLRLSQQKLADHTGNQRGTVTRWENGDAIPRSVEMLVRGLWLGKAKGCPLTTELLEEWERQDACAVRLAYRDTGTGWSRAA
ncbi:MAG: helix-turn-helix domain-containing protein [Alphaproteobacteria bacterium]|nr:helix-turn-helix domain-containing protein [Alphaproteobacteria bacterium]